MSLYFFILLLLLEWKTGVARWILRILQKTFERYTAPEIEVPPPKLFFDEAPGVQPLSPRTGPEGFIQCYDKGTNVPLGTVKAYTADDVRAAVAKARVAQRTWALTPFSTRRRLLFALMDYILDHQQEIARTGCIEGGKTMMDSALGELLTTFEKLRWTAANGEEVLKEEVRDVGLIAFHKRAALNYVPFGVIGAIVSWNYPFHNIYGPMISALFSGNAFVGKVSEYSSYYAAYYQSIVHNGLLQLGYSPDLVTFVTGFAEAGEALVSSVDKLTFIGSPGVGKIVMRNAASTLTPVVLELGGKDAAVVCDDADLDQVIPIVMRGTFQNCGQNCVGLERVVVQDVIHDRLVGELTQRVQALTQGPASQGHYDLGAMTMGQLAIEKIQRLVDDSVAAGAKLVCGGKATKENFFPPTILTNVKATHIIAQEEVFGPVLVVMQFKTDREAIEIVNACPYSLGSSVFSMDKKRARYIADRLRTGMVNINDFGINYLCQSLPFGGVGISGFDRFAGREGLRGNCIVRASTTDRIPGTLPGLSVEKRFLRQLQAVFPWYALRKRIREQNNEFLEIDLGACDPELVLRYAHVYYSRRQIQDELIERQLTMLETGKMIKLSDDSLLECLTDCDALISRRLGYELYQLQKAKRACNVAHRRELRPDEILEPHDYLCMMRVVEEDVCGVSDAEMKARAYLPRSLVECKAQEFIGTLVGGHILKKEGGYRLDKKEQKLLQHLIPADYAKIGCTQKLRPVDVTTYYRFAGERLSRIHPTEQYFKRCLYGHVCRKMATHPAYMRSISMYWARYSGLDTYSSLTTMPPELAEAVCVQQSLFPALKFHSQFLYSSPDLARQMWRAGNVVPLMRLYPLLGAPAAEDLAAGMVVEAEWAALSSPSESVPLQEDALHTMREAIEQASDWYISNRGALYKRVQEGVKVICPPLSEKEKELFQADGDVVSATAAPLSS